MRTLFLILLAAAALAGPAEEFAAIRKETDAAKRKKMLATFLKTRRPSPKSEDEDIAETYNQAVRLAHTDKLKAKFLTKKTEVREFDAKYMLFAFERIRGRTWNWQPPKKHDVLVRRKAGVLSRGTARRVRLHIWVFDLDQGDVDNPGGSPKRAAGVWLAHLQKQLTQPQVRQKPAKRKFNRHYGTCWTFEVAGRTGNGTFLSHRCWFVVPKKGKLAMFQVEATDDKPDPELDLMLATLRDG